MFTALTEPAVNPFGLPRSMTVEPVLGQARARSVFSPVHQEGFPYSGLGLT